MEKKELKTNITLGLIILALVVALIVFIPTDETQREIVKNRTRVQVEKQVLSLKPLYCYTLDEEFRRYLYDIFYDIAIPGSSLPCDLYTKYFPGRFEYVDAINDLGMPGDQIVNKIKDIPWPCGVFCKRVSGGCWHIIAIVETQ